MANFDGLVGNTRPEWQKEAKCRAMGSAFTSATVEEQVAVCDGTTAPWDTPCNVKQICLDAFVEQVVTISGLQLAYDNVIVHGGLDKRDLLQVCRDEKNRRLKELEEMCVQDPRSGVMSSHQLHERSDERKEPR